MSALLTQSPGDTVQTGTGKVDPARKFIKLRLPVQYKDDNMSELQISMFFILKTHYFTVVSLQCIRELRISTAGKLTGFILEQLQYLPYLRSDKGFKETIVNRALQSLYKGPFES